jgi:hypothetical protein
MAGFAKSAGADEADIVNKFNRSQASQLVAYDREVGYMYYAYGPTLLIFNAPQTVNMVGKGGPPACLFKKKFDQDISCVVVEGKYLYLATGIDVLIYNSQNFLHSMGNDEPLMPLRIPLEANEYVRQLAASPVDPKVLIITSGYELWEFNGNL